MAAIAFVKCKMTSDSDARLARKLLRSYSQIGRRLGTDVEVLQLGTHPFVRLGVAKRPVVVKWLRL